MAYFTEARMCDLDDRYLKFGSYEGGTGVWGENGNVKCYICVENLKEK